MKYRLLHICIVVLTMITVVITPSESFSASAMFHPQNLVLAQASGEEEKDFFFRDDFTGTTLKPEWDILNEDPDRWTLYAGDYFLVVITRADERVKNELRFKKDLPNNFEATVKFISPFPGSEWDFVRLALIEDRKNALELLFSAYQPNIEFKKYLRGEKSDFDMVVERREEKPYFLKIVKSGIEYSGYYSLDGRTWTKIGTHIFLNLNGKVHIGAWGSGPERGVKFDYFQIKEID